MNRTPRSGRKGDLGDIDSLVAEALTFLGLTAYEIRVYDAILRHPRSRVPEIARESRVPQPKVYATIKRLTERGLLQSHLGAINQYSALEPDDSFEPLLAEARHRHANATKAIERLQAQFDEADAGMSRREGRVKLFQGKAAAGRDFRELMSSAERDVAIVVRFPLVVSDYVQDIRRIRANGGQVRLLLETKPELSAEAEGFVAKTRKAGAELRRSSEVPTRLGVFDARILVLPMHDPSVESGDGFTMLEVRNPELCVSFQKIFDLLWAKARPL